MKKLTIKQWQELDNQKITNKHVYNWNDIAIDLDEYLFNRNFYNHQDFTVFKRSNNQSEVASSDTNERSDEKDDHTLLYPIGDPRQHYPKPVQRHTGVRAILRQFLCSLRNLCFLGGNNLTRDCECNRCRYDGDKMDSTNTGKDRVVCK